MSWGLVGSVFLALCGFPEAIRCYINKSCSLGWPMLIMWFIGEICVIVYAIQIKQYVLCINYVANLVFLLIMMRYKPIR